MRRGSDNRLYSGATPEQVTADLEPLVDFQDEGLPLETLSELIQQRLIPHLVRYDLPAFHSLFNLAPEQGAKLGARIALEYNQGVTNWQVSPGGAMLEELSCKALCRMFGFAPGADATVLYCGSYANQQALYMALHRRAEERGFDLAQEGLHGFGDPTRLAVVTSTDAHFSLRHAVRMLGLGEQSLLTVGVDRNRRIDVTQLREAVGDSSRSKEIFCIVATAGTTPTGSVDPIQQVADACDEVGTWLHVDGAYGLAYKLVPEWQGLFEGVERADSVSWDPHKQFGVPIPSSVLFARRQQDFNRMALFSSYWNREDLVGPNPGLKSVPSTRPLTALPLVTSIRHLGMTGVVERLRAPLVVIRELAEYLGCQADMELSHQPDTGIACFRIVPAGYPTDRLNELQRRVYEIINREGERSISLSQLDDKTVLRLVAISPAVTFTAMAETIDRVRAVAAAAGSGT